MNVKNLFLFAIKLKVGCQRNMVFQLQHFIAVRTMDQQKKIEWNKEMKHLLEFCYGILEKNHVIGCRIKKLNFG